MVSANPKITIAATMPNNPTNETNKQCFDVIQGCASVALQVYLAVFENNELIHAIAQ